MTNEATRLCEWMAEQGMSTLQLLSQLGYGRVTHRACFEGDRPFPVFFKWQFANKFGSDTAIAVFDLTDAQRASIDGSWSETAFFPEQYAAQRAVNEAVKNGEMLPAKAYKCHGCDQQATEYHHESYAPEDRLCVVPLCRKCHRRHHAGHKLDFGVVPTSIGLVRIAISQV